MNTPTVEQLKHAVAIAEQIQKLQSELRAITGGNSHSPVAHTTAAVSKPTVRRKMSAAGRAAIVRAQKARWAKLKGKKTPARKAAPATKPAKKKGGITAAG